MSMSMTCECGRSLEAPESIAGARVRCSDCGRELTVPAPVLRGEELADSWEVASPRTSGKAMYSLFLGSLFFFLCISGMLAIHFGIEALREIKRSKGQLRGRRMALAGIAFGVIDCLLLIALFVPPHRTAREAARRGQCTNNLKQLGLALQCYRVATGSFPPAAITDKDGKPLLSWRVALLPYIDTGSPYWHFHLDEPWDSPHNIAVVELMPPIYNCPSAPTRKRGMTGYMAVIGAGTVFRPDFQPVRFQDISDRTEQTILVAESPRTVPWSKPEDIPVEMALAPDGLGSHHEYHNDGFNALFVDGSVRFLKRSIASDVLGRLLSRNGGEDVSSDSY